MKRQIIHNTNQVFTLSLILLLFIHLAACVNIFQGTGEDSWIILDDRGAPAEKPTFSLYIDQIYFMTTTMTTLGYGDFNAVKRPEYDSADNMELISFIQFTAIFTFTLIQAYMLALVFDVSMSTVLKKARFDA